MDPFKEKSYRKSGTDGKEGLASLFSTSALTVSKKARNQKRQATPFVGSAQSAAGV
jgi:hypothetical protein